MGLTPQRRRGPGGDNRCRTGSDFSCPCDRTLSPLRDGESAPIVAPAPLRDWGSPDTRRPDCTIAAACGNRQAEHLSTPSTSERRASRSRLAAASNRISGCDPKLGSAHRFLETPRRSSTCPISSNPSVRPLVEVDMAPRLNGWTDQEIPDPTVPSFPGSSSSRCSSLRYFARLL
jgi:hypothetical protein